MKLALDNHDPILIERFGKSLVLIGRSFARNGVFIRHPEFIYRLDEGVWQPVSYRLGDEIYECADLDDEEILAQVDRVHERLFVRRSHDFAQTLLDEGWLERSVCAAVTPIVETPSVN